MSERRWFHWLSSMQWWRQLDQRTNESKESLPRVPCVAGEDIRWDAGEETIFDASKETISGARVEWRDYVNVNLGFSIGNLGRWNVKQKLYQDF